MKQVSSAWHPRPVSRVVARCAVSLVVVLLGLAGLCATTEVRRVASVQLAGVPVPRSGPLEAYLERRALRWSEESLAVQAGHQEFHPTRAELGAALSVDEAAAEIRALGHSANPRIAMRDWWVAMVGPSHELPWRARISAENLLAAYVERIRAAVDRLPLPGSFDPEGRPIAGLAGEALDVAESHRALRAAIRSGATHVRIPTTITTPPTSYRRVDDVASATVLMFEQETEYRPGQGRGRNIELAAQRLDGKVLPPGGSFSFNTVVGKRERTLGFAPALELVNGEVVPGIGGGVCQVAGTLHAAAFFAGLVVDEYRPHSRLSQLAYLRPGLDTMVAWPDHVSDLRATKDLRLRNPYPFPILIRASFEHVSPHRALLRTALYGAAKAFRVDWSFEEIERVPAGEVRRVDPSLAAGAQHVKQEGLDGIVILRRRTIYMPTGRAEEEARVAYPPTPRIVLTGGG
jgi:vancomycin resistance protein YoaR